MERRVILDFISLNFKELKKIDLEKINIFLYGKSYAKNSFSSQLLNGEKLFAYDVKLPRIYCKTFPLEKMTCGLLDFAETLSELTIFSKTDFNFELEDVYTGKNVYELDFNYLYLLPIIKDGMHQGLICFYANCFDESFKVINTSVTSLYNSLQELDILMFEQNVTNKLVNYHDYYFLLYQKEDDNVILSDSLASKLNISHYALKSDTSVVNFRNHHLVKEKKLDFPFEKYYIVYIEKNIYDDQKSMFLHISAIKNLDLPKDFTLVIVDWSQSKENFVDLINKANLNVKYHICAYDEEFYLLFILNKLTTTKIKKIIGGESSLFYVLHAPKDINNMMDYEKVMTYIKNIKPVEFNFIEFTKYLQEVNYNSMLISTEEYKNRVIISSVNKEKKGVLINFVAPDFIHHSNALEFERRTISKLNNYLKTHHEDVFACMHSVSLLKRKTIELYKKYFNKNISLSLIIHYDKMVSKDEFIKSLATLKEYNVFLYADSSIFLNLEFIDLMRYFSGCFVKKAEFKSINSSPNEFVNVFVNHYFNNNMTIIFDNDEEENIKKYEDELIYFIKEREGR